MEKLTELQQETAAYNARIEKLLKEIEAELRAKPENEAITPLNASGSCYTMKLSDLNKPLKSKGKNINNWSAKFHSFKHQYDMIFTEINKCKNAADKVVKLVEIFENEYIKNGSGTERIHPQVINHLKSIL